MKRGWIFRRGTLHRQKKMLVSVRLGQIGLGFFLTENCPTAKNPKAFYNESHHQIFDLDNKLIQFIHNALN